jgi:HTH-type transcriptional regulator, sugar sensing transcriptional regulator
MAAQKELVNYLVSFGLTGLEAEIYLYLVQNSPATGYKVAKGTGRSFTSVYKALEMLQTKGAILLQEGKNRLSRAVPIDEFLQQQEARAKQQRLKAAAAINALSESSGDTRIYHLSSIDQVYERCRHMLDECRERALIEVFPEPCRVLRDSIEAAAARGLSIAVRTYGDEELAGTIPIKSPFGDTNLKTFKSQCLAIFIDGCQFLISDLSLDGESVHEAIWSANLPLSRSYYSYANSDLCLYAFLPLLEKAESVEEAREAYQRVQAQFPPGGDLGFGRLLEIYGGADESNEDEQNGKE